MNWVLDCSFSAALFLPDEHSGKIRKFFENLNKKNVIIVPPLWWYELSNVLSVSVRRKRLNHSDVVQVLSLFDQIDIQTDNEMGSKHSIEIYMISQQYNISAYDASYLELAIRKKTSLASLDKKLFNAAVGAGLSTFTI
jgi:predicted nucleic acid-binding protein